jgi:DNA-binding NarL/FixJ family response regulator
VSTHCRYGHPYDETNTYWWRGNRYCRACQRVAERRYRQRTPDEMAILRAVMGDPPARLTAAERQAAVLRLRRRGLSAEAIAARVRCTPRTVWRIAARTREAA